MVHRLRDLDRRQAVVAGLLALLLVGHVAVSVGRAVHHDFIPSGDDALIGLRADDVFGGHVPLIGQPSTSHLYGPEEGTSHPGPIEFFWLSVPMAALGATTGMLLGAAAFNAAAALIAAWVVFRRAGPRVGAGAAVLLSLLLWSEGTAILSDAISSNAGGIPLIALAALAWAIVDGDVRLLPLGAVVGTWVAQQHLSIALPAAAMVGYAVVGLGVRAVLRRRRGDEGDERWWPWVAGAISASLVLWSTVIWQQLTGKPGNLTAVVRYARRSDTEPLGALAGIRQLVRATGFPPLLVRHDLTGEDFFRGPLGVLEVLVSVAVLTGLVAVVVGWRRRRPALSLMALTALVLGAAGAYNGATIPDSVEAFRINFYRWPFAMAWLTWTAFGWSAAILWRDRRVRATDRAEPAAGALARWVAPVGIVVAAALPVVLSAATAGVDDERRDQAGFGAFTEMADAARREAAGADGVTVVLRGRSAVLAAGSAVSLQLEDAGHAVTVPEQEARFWGAHRVLDPDEAPGDVILVLASGRGAAPPGPGRTVARVDLNEDLRDELAPLLEQAADGPVVLAEDAEDVLARNVAPPHRDYLRGLLATLGSDPARVLTDPELIEIVADGYFASPTFDPDDLDALRRELPGRIVNEDDVFELRVVTPEELDQIVPNRASVAGGGG